MMLLDCVQCSFKFPTRQSVVKRKPDPVTPESFLADNFSKRGTTATQSRADAHRLCTSLMLT